MHKADEFDDEAFIPEEEADPRLKKNKMATTQNTSAKKGRGGKNTYFL